ncbi:fimbrial protein [Yersinia ruckeri]|uniref:fimbrial protein n=1 Tax=Yersinia ruckeri TaxID=29486 RepID=UPI002238A54D|nr:fimbrial protein [Yersinia ruckeri]MCW6568530.1 fimbrial protein [Yersinia ruckeri]
MFNLKNKPLATGYFTKKSFSLLAVAIIGYLLTPAASANSPSHPCGGNSVYMKMQPGVVLTYDRSGAVIAPQNIFTADSRFEYICTYYLPTTAKKIYYELEVDDRDRVNGYDNVFETDIPGIGVQYALTPGPHCTQDPGKPMEGECDTTQAQNDFTALYPKFSLVNYGDSRLIPQGDITIEQELIVYYSVDHGRRNILGHINIHPITFKYKRYGCTLETPSVNLPLGEVKANEFRGIGSMSKTNIAKQIHLTCDPDTSYSLTINGKSVANYPDILQLDQTSGHASGIGVKFEAGDSTKKYQDMKLGEETYMHKTDSNGVSIKKIIDIRASYFQTENRITPGTANASATFTVTYQ